MYTVKLPRLGEGIFEAQVVNLYVHPGMTVSEDTILAEMQTDKAAGELQSPTDGTISDVLIKEGQYVYLGDPLILIDDGSDTPPDLQNKVSRVYKGPSSKDSKSLASSQNSDKVEATKVNENKKPVKNITDYGSYKKQSNTDDEKKTSVQSNIAISNNDNKSAVIEDTRLRSKAAVLTDKHFSESTFTPTLFNRLKHNPRKVRAMLKTKIDAKNNNIDLSKIVSGNEVVTQKMLGEIIEKRHIDSPEKPFKPIDQYAPDYTTSRPDDEERVELSYIRKFNASSYEVQHKIVPPFTLFETIDILPLINFIDSTDHLSNYLPFVVKALVLTAKKFPRLNAALDDTVAQFVYRKYYNVGIDRNTSQGMFTPVLKDADLKSIEAINEEVEELTSDMLNKNFEWDNLSNATISITDCSDLPVSSGHFSPIIHYPQVACLGLGSVRETPVVYEGEIVAQTSLPVSLTVDYRVVDRKEAFSAMAFFKKLMENPKELLTKC